MLHAKYLAVVTDYEMYLECDEGGKEEKWKVEKPTTFWEFCEKLSYNMLNYNITHCLYPGDEWIRVMVVYNQE